MSPADLPPDSGRPGAADRRLIECLRGPFPLSERPFADLAQGCGLTEEALIERLRHLLAQGVLTHFGPLLQVEAMGGERLLAALCVPEDDFERIAQVITALPEVTHADKRDHALNLWIVLAVDSPAHAAALVSRLGVISGLDVQTFATQREYGAGRSATGRVDLTGFDRALIASTQSGLPLLPRPYEALAAMLGVSDAQVRARLAALLDAGVIRRIGAVTHHERLGDVVHGLTVWDVDDTLADTLGEQVSAMPGLGHAYRRTRQRPAWPYNLFVMVHGRTRADVEQKIWVIRGLLGAACASCSVLYGLACLKKAGLRLEAA